MAKSNDKPHSHYSRLEEIVFIRNFKVRLGITTIGFGSTEIGGTKELRNNKYLVKLNGADFFSKIRAQHSDTIIKVTDEQDNYYKCDALIVSTREMCKRPLLIANTADCPIIAIVDNTQSVFGLVHSGWKGTKLNVVGKTVSKISESFKIPPENLRAFIWPGITEKYYQVDPSFKDIFPKWISSSNHLNLKMAIKDQLLEAGLFHDQVWTSRKCSYSSIHPDRSFKDLPLFYSYRRVTDYYSDHTPNPQQVIYQASEAKKRNCVFLTAKP